MTQEEWTRRWRIAGKKLIALDRELAEEIAMLLAVAKHTAPGANQKPGAA